MKLQPNFSILTAPDWPEYELIDSGDGQKLERYGPYTFVRPEHQAIWHPALHSNTWDEADAVFQPTQAESGGYWKFNRLVQSPWTLNYKGLRFQVQASPSRHMGVFPEQATHWDWIQQKIQEASQKVQVLNLFGYTGIASLAAAQSGAAVTHVDASKKTVEWAKINQQMSNLSNKPVRWIVDDVVKFVHREVRRGTKYQGLILDPPKFGRGPSGQVWELFEALPGLLNECHSILSDHPLFIVLTAYAIRASALSLYYLLDDLMHEYPGEFTFGELAIKEKSAGRLLSTAIFARWSAGE